MSAALTSINLRRNELGTAGWCAIFNALRDNKENTIASWDLSPLDGDSEIIDAKVAKAIAEYVAVSGALTSLNLSDNKICAEGINAIADALDSLGDDTGDFYRSPVTRDMILTKLEQAPIGHDRLTAHV